VVGIHKTPHESSIDKPLVAATSFVARAAPADELFDAALARLDLGELIMIPSPPEASDWVSYDAARKSLRPKLSRSHPASRYKIKNAPSSRAESRETLADSEDLRCANYLNRRQICRAYSTALGCISETKVMRGLSRGGRRRLGKSRARAQRSGWSEGGQRPRVQATATQLTFKAYIADPKAEIPGTKMRFRGIKNESEASNLWGYLEQFDATGKREPELCRRHRAQPPFIP
jgi:hypothetical protein